MKKTLVLILVLALAITSLASCTYVPTVDADVITMITIDAGASVELMVNPKNNVSVATPLNDQAAIIMYGEDITGQKPDEAAAEFVSLAAKAGFLTEATVKLSVTGNSDYVEVITELITKKAVKAMKKEGIKGNVEIVDPISEADLRALCLEKKYIVEEDAAYYTYKDLIYAVASQKMGHAGLLSEELINLYDIFDRLNYNYLIKAETLADLTAIKDSYPAVYSSYSSALNAYKAATDELIPYYISVYLTKDSQYQLALSAVRDAREAVLNGSGSAEALKTAEDAFSAIKASLKKDIDSRIEAVDLKFSAIEDIESTFMDTMEVELHLRQTYLERTNRLKEKLIAASAEFGTRFESEINLVQTELATRKKNVIK